MRKIGNGRRGASGGGQWTVGREALTVGGISSALVTVGIWAAKQFWGVDVPATLAPEMTALVTAIGFFLVTVAQMLAARNPLPNDEHPPATLDTPDEKQSEQKRR